MINKIKITYLAALLTLSIFSACEKDGVNKIPKILALKDNFRISGFVLGDTIEQYFDGVKMREYYGLVQTTSGGNQLAFIADDINMELRKKSTGETIYRQTFNINDKQNVVPKFFYDGITFSNRYVYPDPQGTDYTVNFNFDFPKGSDPVDVIVEELEYIYVKEQLIVLNTIEYPIATNVPIGKFSGYYKITPMTYKNTTPIGSDFYPVVVIKNAKTKEYYINKDLWQSEVRVEIPYEGGGQGKVQSFYLNKPKDAQHKDYLQQYDLVQIFPR